MIQGRLNIERPPFRLAFLPHHEGCWTEGRVLTLMEESRKTFHAAEGRMDPVCLRVHEQERRKLAHQKQYGMSMVVAMGNSPTILRLAKKRVELSHMTYALANPLESLFFEPDGGFSAIWLFWSQSFLRTIREAAGIPREAGPFDFEGGSHAVPNKLRGALKRVQQQIAPPKNFRPSLWDPLLVYGEAVNIIKVLWECHSNRLKNRSVEVMGEKNTDPRLKQVVRRIRAELATPIDFSALARQEGLSESTMKRLFHQRFGCPPRTYLRRTRVEIAERLLMFQPAPKWQQVAEAVGFASAWALKQAIRSMRGTPP